MLLSIEHRTIYRYSWPVGYTIQQCRLTPPSTQTQQVRNWQLLSFAQMTPQRDYHGNASHALVIDIPHETIEIIAKGEVETGDYSGMQHPENLPLAVYLRATPLTEIDLAILTFAQSFELPANATDIDTVANFYTLMHAVLAAMPYTKGATNVTTSAIQAFDLKQGVCQDHAHVFIACCRALNYPARYVSGYLFTADFSLMETHAWAEVWCGEAKGWQGFDVSNGVQPDALYVKLAVGLDYREACPISGMRQGGGTETMLVQVSVNQSQQHQLQQSQQ